MRLLIDNGADIEAKDRDGLTVLGRAAKKQGNESIMRLLISKGANVKARDKKGRTLLHHAIKFHDNISLPALRLLLKNGVDINAMNENEYNRTALHLAVLSSNKDVVRLFLEQGSGILIDAMDDSGFTALHRAAQNGDLTMVELLLRGKTPANIEKRDNDGRTALHWAAWRESREQHHEVIELLLQSGADVEAKANNGMTASEEAIERGFLRYAWIMDSFSFRPARDHKEIWHELLREMENQEKRSVY